MGYKFPRLAARAIIVEAGRLLLVNAYPGGTSDLWCAPGGGIEAGSSIPDNLTREVHEETGLTISIGGLLGINEFHDPESGYHQVDLFFRAAITDGTLTPDWKDPENVVTQRRFFTESQLENLRFKPDILPHLAFGPVSEALYDPFEAIVR
ncbi:NUDIX domain-containing protein [Algicella marina]|uniref:NUDIX domain-containing protein n=1 Tax=Algicella marina TaxID=2683284 RepID=A0A6P1SW22_9RHOB|nr:NUDIX hydrolase [Algicella marina]QHQ33691.1 NUDIX domain-containing protein [Algicella marina]